MEKFIVSGYSFDSRTNLSLNLPQSKRFLHVAVKNSETETFPEALISKAVERKKHETTHVRPSVWVDGKSIHLPRTLQHLLASHPFPLNQGPVVIPLDTNTETKISVTEVMQAKTVFSHRDTQPCARWVPEVLGTSAWTGKQGQEYNVTDLVFSIQGAASNVDMSLVYTCHLAGCVIHCSCHICTDKGNDCCKNRHKSELCRKCNSQCTTHQINVPYMFNPATDLYTLVTEKMDKYRFGYGYAGIPSNCSSCSQDVLEHQMLHLVYHTLCRFCRFEMRPLEFRSVRNLTDYKKAEIILNWRDGKTCSVCLLESKDKYAREKHEATVHRQEPQKFKCDLCPKSYSSKSSLSYHIGKHQQTVEKPTCDLCGSQFASEGSLSRHKQIIHKTEGVASDKLSCDCGQQFSLLAHLRRHQREQHFDLKLNSDFYEGNPPATLECNECDMKFKRNADLRRHISSAHGEKAFNCLQCDCKFSRKDNLKRHMNSKH